MPAGAEQQDQRAEHQQGQRDVPLVSPAFADQRAEGDAGIGQAGDQNGAAVDEQCDERKAA